MTLKAYFQRPDAISASKLAGKIGISKGRISQIRNGEPCPAEIALAIERETGGVIDAADLSQVVADARVTA